MNFRGISFRNEAIKFKLIDYLAALNHISKPKGDCTILINIYLNKRIARARARVERQNQLLNKFQKDSLRKLSRAAILIGLLRAQTPTHILLSFL